MAAILASNRLAFVDFVASRVESRAVAEDIVQEQLARALLHVGELREEAAAVGWFYQSLRNAIVDHHRRGAAGARAMQRYADEASEEVPVEEPRRICPCVAKLSKTLKPEYAEALQRVEVDGRPVKDVAAELGISANNAAVRVFRAREALRKEVATPCGACAEAGCTDCSCAGV